MTTAPEGALPSEGSCFLTVHATVLCFAGGGFVHVPVGESGDRGDLVVAAAPPAALRTLGEPLRVELGRGLALVASASGQAATVNLSVDGAFLSAGDSGGAIVRTGAPRHWEEFLPLAPASLGRLRALVAHDVVSLPDRRLLPASGSAILPDFGVLIGGRPVSLREADLLDGGAPGRMVLWAGRRFAGLQRVRPVLVFRHDGTAEADAEIALGLASLAAAGGFPGRVVAEFEGDLDVPGGVDRVARPAGPPGLLHFTSTGDPEAGPILFVANGVLFDGPAAPIVAAAACLPRIAAAPWLRGAWEIPPALEGEAIDPAIVAGPTGHGWRALAGLVAAAGDPVQGDDGEDAVALQMALAADAPIGANPLRGFVAAGGPETASLPAAARGLLNLRAVPREIRADVMREHLAR